MFRFGATVAQDLTYTIGWLVFGMGLLAAGITLGNRSARVAAVTLIAVTTFKCFLYDLSSLEGLARVASFVGLAISLALVSVALQKFVLEDEEPRREARAAAGCGDRAVDPSAGRPRAKGARVDLRASRRDGRRWPLPVGYRRRTPHGRRAVSRAPAG